VVTGRHRQERSLYQDNSTSSPTVAISSVLTIVAIAARDGHCVMTLDHMAEYKNAEMSVPSVKMISSAYVAAILCKLNILIIALQIRNAFLVHQ
jgi:hypothetical protein